MPGPADYHRLSFAEKADVARDAVCEPAIACPSCDTKLQPRDLIPHIKARCAGLRDPGPASTWITWRQVLEAGVPRDAFQSWIRRGQVRMKGDRGDRKYLLRDVAMRTSGWLIRMAARRR